MEELVDQVVKGNKVRAGSWQLATSCACAPPPWPGYSGCPCRSARRLRP